MTTPDDDDAQFITAEQAIFETELAAHGLTDGGVIGKLEQDEAQKLAEYLFADEEEGLPEELRASPPPGIGTVTVRVFFRFPEEES